ncbi:hypothetical protein BV454_00916 [Bacillus altitudinis]|nr:hypothetical protein [Bacillus altitudinis]
MGRCDFDLVAVFWKAFVILLVVAPYLFITFYLFYG